MMLPYPNIVKEPQQGGLLSLIRDHIVDLSLLDDISSPNSSPEVEPRQADAELLLLSTPTPRNNDGA